MKKKTNFNFKPFLNRYQIIHGMHTPLPSSDDLAWFIGFMEGDGSLFVTNKHLSLGKLKLCIAAYQHSDDKHVLEIIKNLFKCGRIEKSSASMHRWIVNDIKHVSLMLSLFNGNAVCSKFYQRLQDFLNHYNQKVANPKATLSHNQSPMKLIKQTVEPSLKDAWFSGFCDAEGCFYARWQPKTTKCRSGWKVSFSVGQKGQKNKNLFEHLRTAFNAGNVAFRPFEDFVDLRMTSLNHCLKVTIYFKTFALRSKKRFAFNIWSSLLHALHNKVHKTPEGQSELLRLADQINAPVIKPV